MIKDYFLQLLDWWRETVVIGNKHTPPTFKEGEIWWCSMGMNIGHEIFGKGARFTRPVIVFKKLNKYSFLAIPLTTQVKDGSWYIPISHGGVESRAILSQIRVVDGIRLTIKIGTLNSENFQKVKDRLLEFYGS
jgi:mRNA interferase MazF